MVLIKKLMGSPSHNSDSAEAGRGFNNGNNDNSNEYETGGDATEAAGTRGGFEIEDISGMGYHDEFMSRMNEFSLSWRKAAEKERKLH